MSTPTTCVQCGAGLPGDAPGGNCPSCLLRLLLDTDGSAGVAAPAPSLLGHFGDYQLVAELARGGMGVIYRAHQDSLHRDVALKMILAGLLATPEQVKRFRGEAEAAARLDHPNIVPIYDVGEHDGQQYFTMKLIEGPNLAQHIKGGHWKGKDDRDVARFVATLAHAVHYAHQRGIIHRDLKPTNILIDREGTPHVTDFGLAKLLEVDGSLTQSAALLGTPNYMAPEQASGQQVTTAADVYGLGGVLYELLTGQPPVGGPNLPEILLRVIHEDVKPPASLRPGVNRDLETICLKCLHKDPDRRYGSAEALALDLERWLHHEPIQARPCSTWERLAKWPRRKPVAAAVTAVLALAAVALLVVVWSYQGRLHAKDVQTVRERERTHAAMALNMEEAVKNGEMPRAIAYLADTLRQARTNRWAAERLLSTLKSRSFAVPIFEPLRHSNAVNLVQFSPDGERILTASDDGTARMWDARNGQPLGLPMQQTGSVRMARFSSDGQFIVTAGGNGLARIWEAKTGTPVSPAMEHPGEVHLAAFSPDGTQLLTAAGKMVRVWNVRTGQPASSWLKHTNEIRVRSAQFHPDGKHLLTVDGEFALEWEWTSDGPAKCRAVHSNMVRWACYSPNGRRIAVGSGDNNTYIWRLAESNSVIVLPKHGGDVDLVDFSPDGGRVVTASKDRTARVWDTHTGDALAAPLPHGGRVAFACFSPDSLRLLTLAEDRAVRIWDLATGELVCEPLRHQEYVGSAAFSPDGLRVATACADGAARVWDVRPGEQIAQTSWAYHGNPDQSHDVRLTSQMVQVTNLFPPGLLKAHLKQDVTEATAHLAPDGQWILARDAEGRFRIYDELSGKVLTAPFNPGGPVFNIAFSPDRKRFATVTRDHKVRVWEAASGRLLHDAAEHTGALLDPVFSPDGERLLVAENPMALRIWQTAAPTPVTEPFTHHKESVLCARFSPDGRWLVTGSYDKTALICDAQSGRVVHRPLRHDGFVYSVDFSPNGEYLATGALDMFASVWNVRTGRRLGEPLKHSADVRAVRFAPDGKRLATFTDDRSVRFWEASTGFPLSDPMRHHIGSDLRVWLGDFSADGRQLITYPRPSLRHAWDVEAAGEAAPEWFPFLAEAIGGLRFDDNRSAEWVPEREFFEWRRKLADVPPTNSYTRWARWFFADRSTRTLSPSSTVTIPAYVRRLAQEERWPLVRDTAREVVRLAPTNGLALTQLVWVRLHELNRPGQPHARRLLDEADFYSLRALELDPTERESWLARLRYLKQTRQQTNAVALIEQARARFPGDPKFVP